MWCDVPAKPFCQEKKLNELENCATWFDGCNTCMVRDGRILGCTKMYCQEKSKPYCKKQVDSEENALKDCAVWYDGCNTCRVNNGKIGGCTRMACRTKAKAYCKKKVEKNNEKPLATNHKYSNCRVWFDGCDSRKVINNGTELALPRRACRFASPPKQYCKEFIND